jgi:hypothetical protein
MRYLGKRAAGISAAVRGWVVAGGAQAFDLQVSGFIREAAACRIGGTRLSNGVGMHRVSRGACLPTASIHPADRRLAVHPPTLMAPRA